MLAHDLAPQLLLPSASQQLYLARGRTADADARAFVARLRVDARFSLRLRLALRAPNVEARLAHCRDLLRLIEADKGDQLHVG